jgi:hypothetical protein
MLLIAACMRRPNTDISLSMKIIIPYLFILFALFLIPLSPYAQSPIGKQGYVVIPKFSFYTQTSHFDAEGNIIRGGSGEKFNTYILNIHYGYGITDKLDFVVDLPYLFEVSSLGNGKAVANNGCGDLLIGFNYNMVKFNNSRFLSIQFLGVLPLYRNNNVETPLGLQEYGNEVTVSYFGALSEKTYFNTDIAYRKYYNNLGPDQLTLDGGIGYSINNKEHIDFSISFFRSVSYSGKNSLGRTFVNGVYVERDYGYLKPVFSYSRQVSSNFSLAAGCSYVPYGHNTGAAYGATMSAAFKF